MQQSLQPRELDWDTETDWLDTTINPWDQDGTHGEGEQQDGTPWSQERTLIFSANQLGNLIKERIQDIHTGNVTYH